MQKKKTEKFKTTAAPFKTTSFSLGSKILLSLVGLIMLSGIALTTSTIFLLRNDKKTYTYQLQSSEAFLIGKNFINSFQSTIDLLRLSLSLVSSNATLSDQEKSSLKSVLAYQNSVLSLKIITVKPGVLNVNSELYSDYKDEQLERDGLSKDDLKVSDLELKNNFAKLIKDGHVFLNVSKEGHPGILAVMVTDVDPNSITGDVVIPVAIGFFPIDSFLGGIKASRLTVATNDGQVLYDTDPSSQYLSKNISSDPLYSFALNYRNVVSNGTKEFETNGVQMLGSFYKPGLNLLVLTQTPLIKAMKATYLLTEKFILLGIISIGVAIIFGILFSKSLVSPLQKLYQATKEIAKGNFLIHLKINSKDEIGALAYSFNSMSKEIIELIKERVQKVKLENELAIASTVQQTLIPEVTYETADVEIYSHYQAAAECGGDWWGVFKLGKKTCVMIADVTGHGLPSALLTAAIRGYSSMIEKLGENQYIESLSAADLVSYANRVIYDAAQGKIMMTFFVSIIDHDNGTITYASAGHNPPILFKKNGDHYKKESLVASGVRLGESREIQVDDIEQKTTDIDPGDVLLLYTDGIIEGTNPSGDQFGKKNFRKVIDLNVAKGPKAVVNELVASFLQHNGPKSLDDDVTLVAVKVKNNRTGV
jgi:sigma-B regulation protein RsbU (phosphoserine phosphatase)